MSGEDGTHLGKWLQECSKLPSIPRLTEAATEQQARNTKLTVQTTFSPLWLGY